VFVVVIVVTAAAKLSHFGGIGGDGLIYYAPLRSFFIDHDLDFTNEFTVLNPSPANCLPDTHFKTKTGLVPYKYAIGCSVLWIPFFLLGHWIALLLHAGGLRILATGYSRPEQMAVGLGSVFYGLVGFFLIYKILCRWFTRELSTTTVLLLAFTTNAWYYFVIEPSLSHLCSMFAISLFAYFVIMRHHRIKPLDAFLIGVSAGLMTMVRNQNLPFAVLLLYEFIDAKGRRSLKNYAGLLPFALAGFVIIMLPQIAFWKVVFGSYIAYSYGTESFDFLHPHLLQTLFSPNHGLIAWTPMIAVCLAGLPLFIIKKDARIGLPAALVFLFQWIICSSWWCWWFMISFGERPFLDISIVFALGLAAFLEKIADRPRLLRTFSYVSIVLIAWNLCFSVMYTLFRHNHCQFLHRIIAS
jgi:hypothetical protein